jgi:hypothetical protein
MMMAEGDTVASAERTPTVAGGCQCGAVRYALYAEPGAANICHCRMCQKAFGNFFAPFTGVRVGDFAWTRGAPAVYKSSELVERGFCRDCGTPLSFRYLDVDRIGIAVGSLDDPARVTIAKQIGIESRLPAFATLHLVPELETRTFEPERASKLKSRQRPDGA